MCTNTARATQQTYIIRMQACVIQPTTGSPNSRLSSPNGTYKYSY